jgi:hypothetical protein
VSGATGKKSRGQRLGDGVAEHAVSTTIRGQCSGDGQREGRRAAAEERDMELRAQHRQR